LLDPVELFPEVPNIYAFPSVHAGMVFDHSRVAAYREAIFETVKPGDVVADIGAGTGLLSFLCLQAGAGKVHAVERTDVIHWAKEIAIRNGFAGRMEFHHCDARNVDLGEKVDVIVSEMMGHVAFEEGMAEIIFLARDKYLKPGGALIPQNVVLRAALANVPQIYRNCVDIWSSINGIDFSTMREKAVASAYVTEIPPDNILSEDTIVLSENFIRSPRDTNQNIKLKSWRTGEVNGIALWFDADLSRAARLSSGPRTNTHWQQCFLPFHAPKEVESGTIISLNIEVAFRKSIDEPFTFKVHVD